MIIQEEDFMLKSADTGFDLYYWKESKDKDGNDTSGYKVASYGIRLSTAIRSLINHRLRTKFKSDTILTLKEYMEELKKSEEYILNLVKNG